MLIRVGIEGMDIYHDTFQVGNIRVELTAHENQMMSVTFTAQDSDNRRVLKAPIMENGKVKLYSNVEEAMTDVMRKFQIPSAEKANTGSAA